VSTNFVAEHSFGLVWAVSLRTGAPFESVSLRCERVTLRRPWS